MGILNSHTSDSLLFADMQKGSEQAFEIIFKRYYPMLCAYARQYVELHDAEEVVQDIMLWLWDNRTSLNLKSPLNHYLFRAVKNRCLTRVDRIVLKEKIVAMLYQRFRDQFEDPAFYDVNELSDRIEKAIGNLPETYRTALEMNRFQHKTYKEIGNELGISSKTVDYRIQQALKLLRIELKDFIPILMAILPALNSPTELIDNKKDDIMMPHSLEENDTGINTFILH
jgi:RNA polymerase sigma-70 factor (ECF subfamily)